MSSSDFDAVLASFDEAQRRRVLELLAELDGVADGSRDPDPVAANDEMRLPDDLSPWLVARINGPIASADGSAETFSISAHAQAALRRCAASLVPQPSKPPATPSLIERIIRGSA